ncbi:MAG: glycosyltransferase family 2 protein, partial [Acidimicrobiales bacterium]
AGPRPPAAQPDAAPGRPAGAEPNRPLLSVVVPAYNEAELIVEHLGQLCDYLDQLEDMYRWEVVVVNDGSSDDTGALAEAFAAGRPGVAVLHHERNARLGQALRTAFARCQGDYVVTFDCDLSYSPDHIGRLVTELRATQASVVIASPYHRHGRTTRVPFTRRVLSKGANRFLSFTARGQLSTLTGMVRAYDRRFLETLNLKSNGTEINTEILYKAELLGARVVEIPAHLDWTFGSTGGRRRRSPGSLGASANSYLFSGFIFRPVIFFIGPGLAMLGAAAYTLGWVVWRVWDNFVHRTGGSFDARVSEAVRLSFEAAPYAFVVAGTALILAFQLISLGTLSLQSERYFKELFHFNTTIYGQLVRRRPSTGREG